jgi:hypothetical protein
MEAFNIQSKNKELIIRMDTSEIPTEILLKVIERLRAKYFTHKGNIDENISLLAEEIDQNWWKKNGDEFLNDVKK